jgi:hypothetical protein
MGGSENIPTEEGNLNPTGRREIKELVRGGKDLIEKCPNPQKIEFDAISIGVEGLTVVSVLDKESNSLTISYEILSDGGVIQCKHDPRNPGEIIERTRLKNLVAAGVITTYGPPEQRQTEDGEERTIEPIERRELVLVPKDLLQ